MALFDHISWQLFGHTFGLVLATLAVSLPLGTWLAVLLFRTDLAFRRLWLAAVAVQLFVPMFVYAAAWNSGFGVTGWFTTLLGGQPVWLEGFRGAVWVHAASSLPWVVLIVGCGLRLVEPELEEESLLHTSPGRVLLRVTLRRALPAVGVAGLWVAATTASEMTATDLFGVRTFAEQIYMSFSGGSSPAEGLVGVLPFIATMTGLVLAAVVLLGRVTPPDLPAGVRSRPTMPLGPLRGPLSIAVALAMLALVAVPLGSLIYKAGIEVIKVDAEILRQWSAAKLLERIFGSQALFWRELPSRPEPGVFSRFGEEMWWSLRLGALAATTAAAVGLLLAWWLRGTGRRTVPTLSLLAAAIAMPGPLVALGLIFLLNRPELPWLVTFYDQTLLAPWLALVIRTLPWTTLLLWFALRSVPQDVLDAAAVDGAGPVTRLARIVLPLRLGAVALAWLVAFVLAVGDLAFTVIVLPPGVETLSVRIFRLIHAAADNEVAAVCLVILAALSGVTALAAWLLAVWLRQRGPPR